MSTISISYSFDPVDIERLRVLARLSSAKRVLLMLNARELVVALKRGRLRKQYPDLDSAAINLKLLEELEHAG